MYCVLVCYMSGLIFALKGREEAYQALREPIAFLQPES